MADRETLEIDALFVGAGPASLAGACHLARLLKQHNAVCGHFSEYPHRKTGAGKRMARDYFFRKPKLATDSSHFVFE